MNLSFLTYISLLAWQALATPSKDKHDKKLRAPALEYLYTATVHLGTPLPLISIAGGMRGVVEVLPNSTITGPAINGSIYGGFASSSYFPLGNGNLLQRPAVDLYGLTSDGFSFVVKEVGVGGADGAITRLLIDIGGSQYAVLRDGFVVQRLVEVGRTVTATGWRVKL